MLVKKGSLVKLIVGGAVIESTFSKYDVKLNKSKHMIIDIERILKVHSIEKIHTKEYDIIEISGYIIGKDKYNG